MNTHVILTFSGMHYPCTERQALKILNGAGNQDAVFIINGNALKWKSISDVVTIEMYNTHFAKKREQLEVPTYKNLAGIGIGGMVKKPKSVKMLEQMIIGVRNYMKSTKDRPIFPNGKDPRWYSGSQDTVDLLKKLENQLEILKKQENDLLISQGVGNN